MDISDDTTNIADGSYGAAPLPPTPPTPPTPPPEKKVLKTEDTGKIFEKAICDAYGIPFDGPFKYCQLTVDNLVPRLKTLVSDALFPHCTHTASKGARYDFTSLDGTMHLSAKSNKKKEGQLAPQVVGQPNPKKFCQVLGIPYTTNADLKRYIQENILTILPVLWSYTFDSQIIYYVKETDTIRLITPSSPSSPSSPSTWWVDYQYEWTCSYEKWNNSSSLGIVIDGKKERILEIQFHTKRKNMAIRWSIEAVLRIFSKQFTVLSL